MNLTGCFHWVILGNLFPSLVSVPREDSSVSWKDMKLDATILGALEKVVLNHLFSKCVPAIFQSILYSSLEIKS